jgi:glycosyltransferase involved in cell wall biosynthesis
MTILFLDQYADVGGGQVVLLNLLRRLHGRVDLAVAAPPGALTDAAEGLGVHVVLLDPATPHGMAGLVKRVQERSPERIVVNGARVLPAALACAFSAGAYVRGRKRPSVSYINHSAPGSSLRRAYIAGLLRFVDEVIPVAETQKRTRKTAPFPPLGLEAHEIAASRQIPPSPVRAVKAYGRLDPMKGLDVLAQALTVVKVALPDARAEVAVRPTLEQRDEGYGVATTRALRPFLVEGPRDSSWFSPRDIVVIPSRFGEAVCLTAQEAMARGALVIAAPIGDLAAFVVNRITGLSFIAGDSASLARAIISALTMPEEELEGIAAAGRDLMGTRAEHWYTYFVRHVAT